MAMTSIGVGSGLELDQMVRQLVQLERQPKVERLDLREKTAETNISALGSLKSAMSKLDDALRGLRERDLNSRTAMVTGQPEDNPFFTATASSSAASSNYNIQVNQLAYGSRLQSEGFASSSEALATSNGTMTFSAGDETFDVDVEDGASLQDIARAINRAEGNFGVNASVINTGTESFIVFDSTVTGEGNGLSISSTAGGLDGLTGDESTLHAQRQAQDAQISIDGIEVSSSSNTFQNAIQGVSIEVQRLTGESDEPRLAVDIDRDGARESVDEFISAYNSLMDEIDKLTKFVPEGKSGPLLGDSMVRSIQSRLASIVGNPVEGAPAEMNMLFQMGITTTKEGRLEFDSRTVGGMTGEQRFDHALTQNFDAMVDLFSGENGVATQLRDTIDQYTQSGGLIDGRTTVYENQKKMIDTEREQFERYMESYESNLRQRFTFLDTNIAQMSNSLNYLLQFL